MTAADDLTIDLWGTVMACCQKVETIGLTRRSAPDRQVHSTVLLYVSQALDLWHHTFDASISHGVSGILHDPSEQVSQSELAPARKEVSPLTLDSTDVDNQRPDLALFYRARRFGHVLSPARAEAECGTARTAARSRLLPLEDEANVEFVIQKRMCGSL